MVNSRQILDISVIIVCIGIVVLVAAGMFSKMTGGGMSMTAWFGWHPVLMMLAFPCLMTAGRWSYACDDSWGFEGKTSRRLLHGSLMGASSAVAMLGYLCIFMAHLAKHTFFGYDFATHKWSDQTWRIFHSIFGYIVLLAMLLQASVGVMKKLNLDNGVRTMTFHGTLGRVVMVGGSLNAAVAAVNWGWTGFVSFLVVLLLGVSLVFAVAFPTPSEKHLEDESVELLPNKP